MQTETTRPELSQVELRIADAPADGEAHFLDLLIVLAKRKWMIVSMTFFCAVASLVYSLLLPKIYTANTKILPPQQTQSVTGAMLGQVGSSLGSLAGLAGKDLGIRNPNDLYVAMLQSRTLSDALIQKFNLMSVYKVKRMMDARKRLEDVTDIDSGKNGVISISVQDRDPKRAADIANAYVSELYKLNQTLAVTEAAQRRLFFEQQLRSASDDLARAEQDMRKTQETTGLIQLDDQAKALIASVSTARGQIAAKEVQIQAMKTFATPQNPDLIRAEDELQALKAHLGALERDVKGPVGDLQLPAGKIPSAGLEYVRRLRDVKYYETIFELLAKQLEVAKIDEAKNAAVIQVLDPAVLPEWKSKPKRAQIVIAGIIIGLFMAITAAFLSEAARYAKTQPHLSMRLSLLKRYLFGRRGEA
jgi:tyrosine-protein kinase Etk/Wzc